MDCFGPRFRVNSSRDRKEEHRSRWLRADVLVMTDGEAANRREPATQQDFFDRFEAEVERERVRVFMDRWWFSPVGTAVAGVTFSVLAWSTVGAATMALWAAVLMASALVMSLAITVAPLAAPIDDEGLPTVSGYAHLAAGALMGGLLLISPTAASQASYRWPTLAFLLAFSALAVNSRVGLNSLGSRMLTALWMVASVGLVVAGAYLAAVAAVVFGVMVVSEMRAKREMVNELIMIRVLSNVAAEDQQWAAHHDELTSLLNRPGIQAALRGDHFGDQQTLTALFIDLDRFKQVNDRFGHAAGDLVLVETARRLTRAFRNGDIVGRLGGDEFLVLLGSDATEEAAESMATRAIEALEQPFVLKGGDEAFISASIGVASMDADSADTERLLNDADQALYTAKRSGRRQVIRFDDGNDDGERMSGIETALRRALRAGAIEAEAQPIFDTATGQVLWVELLARFRLPSGALVPPSIFIPIAEEIGLAGDLTSAMLDIAAEAGAQWRNDPILGDAKICVNVSPVEVAQPGLVRRVAEALARNNIEPERLVLELTESKLIDDTSGAAADFEELQKLGVQLAIDDFGTGYSAPGRLLDLPVAVVKLDRSLFGSLGDDPRRLALLRAMRTTAAAVSDTIVAEGIETRDQLDLLDELGIRAAQGYFLCRPVPVDALAAHLDFVGPPIQTDGLVISDV